MEKGCGEVRREDCAVIDTEAAVQRNAAVKYFLLNISRSCAAE